MNVAWIGQGVPKRPIRHKLYSPTTLCVGLGGEQVQPTTRLGQHQWLDTPELLYPRWGVDIQSVVIAYTKLAW